MRTTCVQFQKKIRNRLTSPTTAGNNTYRTPIHASYDGLTPSAPPEESVKDVFATSNLPLPDDPPPPFSTPPRKLSGIYRKTLPNLKQETIQHRPDLARALHAMAGNKKQSNKQPDGVWNKRKAVSVDRPHPRPRTPRTPDVRQTEWRHLTHRPQQQPQHQPTTP